MVAKKTKSNKKKPSKTVVSEEVISENPSLEISTNYDLDWQWAYLVIEINNLSIDSIEPVEIILPQPIDDENGVEYVYSIYDYGNKLSTSKAGDFLSSGNAMCKLFFTIEKMIALLVDKISKSGADSSTEVNVSLFGHELARRKAFESIINLNYNVISDFDPDRNGWGDNYLKIVQSISSHGYGYPEQTPRDNYRRPYGRELKANLKN